MPAPPEGRSSGRGRKAADAGGKELDGLSIPARVCAMSAERQSLRRRAARACRARRQGSAVGGDRRGSARDQSVLCTAARQGAGPRRAARSTRRRALTEAVQGAGQPKRRPPRARTRRRGRIETVRPDGQHGRRTKRATAGGASQESREGASPAREAAIVSTVVARLNGWRPVSISYNTTPSAKTSERASG